MLRLALVTIALTVLVGCSTTKEKQFRIKLEKTEYSAVR